MRPRHDQASPLPVRSEVVHREWLPWPGDGLRLFRRVLVLSEHLVLDLGQFCSFSENGLPRLLHSQVSTCLPGRGTLHSSARTPRAPDGGPSVQYPGHAGMPHPAE